MSMLIRRMAFLLSAVALAVGLSTAAAGTAQAAVTPDSTWNEIFAPYLTAQSNTLCVDVPGGSTSPGAALQLFHCHGYASDGAPQRWQFHYIGSDGWPLYTIKNVQSGLCMTFTSRNVMTQDTCNAYAAYVEMRSENRWSGDPNVELAFIDSPVSGQWSLCITAGNSTDTNHTPLVSAPCDDPFTNGLQIWNL
jgi:hypothetical protein